MAAPRSKFHEHLASAGSISRKNPELLRLHRATGFSVEHLFKVAIGLRPASLACVKSLVKNIGPRNKEITESSFTVAGQQ
jgi:hypothetical protein